MHVTQHMHETDEDRRTINRIPTISHAVRRRSVNTIWNWYWNVLTCHVAVSLIQQTSDTIKGTRRCPKNLEQGRHDQSLTSIPLLRFEGCYPAATKMRGNAKISNFGCLRRTNCFDDEVHEHSRLNFRHCFRPALSGRACGTGEF